MRTRWTVETVAAVDAEIAPLPVPLRARRWVQRHPALTASLEGRLWSRVVPRGEPLLDGALHVSATPAGSLVVVEAPASPGEGWAPQAPRLEDVYHAAIAHAGVRDEEAVA